MSDEVLVFDTTLRDGEQAAGVCFSERDKVEIARRLDALGADVIEAGFPAASSAEAKNVASVAGHVERAAVCALARAVPRWAHAPEDLDAREAVRRGFHTLKGSGRVAGALSLADRAAEVEARLAEADPRRCTMDHEEASRR